MESFDTREESFLKWCSKKILRFLVFGFVVIIETRKIFCEYIYATEFKQRFRNFHLLGCFFYVTGSFTKMTPA